ncbi:MAG: hypothetical protein JW884_02520 [Deltaproteobacteria bacterium]|nr:hypothetical protein [Deltaproteobacteria bacterium]
MRNIDPAPVFSMTHENGVVSRRIRRIEKESWESWLSRGDAVLEWYIILFTASSVLYFAAGLLWHLVAR